MFVSYLRLFEVEHQLCQSQDIGHVSKPAVGFRGMSPDIRRRDRGSVSSVADRFRSACSSQRRWDVSWVGNGSDEFGRLPVRRVRLSQEKRWAT